MFCVALYFFVSSRRRHTRCALVTGVQTCALPIYLRPPEECWDFTDFIAADPHISDRHLAHMARRRPFEVRSYRPAPSEKATQHYQWFRVAAPIGDDPLIHRGFLAFASDMGLLSSAMLPHGGNFSTEERTEGNGGVGT